MNRQPPGSAPVERERDVAETWPDGVPKMSVG